MTTNRSGAVKLNLYYYQLAGAEARERLLLAAAQRWGVPASELSAKDSLITHAATGRTVRYGEVAARAAALEHPNPETITIKSAHEFSLMGTERRNLDVPPKVTGEAVYAIDVKVPGTLHACARACPVWGGDVGSYDFDAIREMPGVRAVVQFPKPDPGLIRGRQFSGGVAVIADSWWRAKTALEALPIEWEYPPYTHLQSEDMQRALVESMQEPGPWFTSGAICPRRWLRPKGLSRPTTTCRTWRVRAWSPAMPPRWSPTIGWTSGSGTRARRRRDSARHRSPAFPRSRCTCIPRTSAAVSADTATGRRPSTP